MFFDDEYESQWPEYRFELMWTEHGGSGLGLSFAEVGELDCADIPWLINRQREQKKREAEALKKAGKRR